MAIPLYATGSLSPTFVPAPPVGVAVKLPSAFALFEWFPTILREPSSAPILFRRRPPQSNSPSGIVPQPDYGRRLEIQQYRGGIPTATLHKLASMLLCLPPILYEYYRIPVPNWSKAPWGLSVLARVTSIFTGTSISPGALLRQRSNHYAFRAGRNLPDKEFRYLRTVIVTAAVYRGFNSKLRFLTSPLNLPAPGRRQPIYFTLRFRIDLCFC